MINKFEMEREDGAFTRLVEVLTNSYLQDGMPKTTATRLKHVSLVATVCVGGRGTGIMLINPFSVWQAELRLRAVKQRYLEQQLVCAELVLALQMVTGQPAVMSVAGAELQHCLSLCPEETLLGVQPAHIRAADPTLAHQENTSSLTSVSLVALVLAPDPSDRVKKGLGNNQSLVAKHKLCANTLMM